MNFFNLSPAAAAALYSAMRPAKSPLQRATEALAVLDKLHGPSQPLTDMRNALEDLEKLREAADARWGER